MNASAATVRRSDWIAAAAVGAIVWTPFLLAVVGWANHWNVYYNLLLTLGGFGFCAVVWAAWKDA